jgi:competence protein ComEA
MSSLLTRRVALAWLLVVAIASAAGAIVWIVWSTGSPPAGAVLVDHVDLPGTPSDEAGEGIPPDVTAVEAAARPRGATPTTVADGRLQTAVQSPTLVPTPTEAPMVVYISGAVNRPGVYSLPPGARIADAVQAAGGTLPVADLDAVNLAARLADEDHIIIPRKGEAPPAPVQSNPRQSGVRSGPNPTPAPASAPTSASRGSKINVNTATAAELEALPGIGPALAARIVAYRQANGPFHSVEELRRVQGIGEAILARIRDLVTTGEN